VFVLNDVISQKIELFITYVIVNAHSVGQCCYGVPNTRILPTKSMSESAPI
jgi:hypothetical protein